MRIIVTKDGRNFVDTINNQIVEKSNIDENKNNRNTDLKNISNSNFGRTIQMKGSKSSNSLFKNTKQSSIYTIPQSIMSNKMSNIVIRQKKISISKNMSDRYSSPLNYHNFLPSLPTNLSRINLSNNNSQYAEGEGHPENESSFLRGFKMNEIINNNTINRLENTMYKNKRIKEKNSSVNESNFRTVYSNRDNIFVIKEKLENMTIAPDNLNLIKYLNDKNDISDKLIEKLDSSDDKQIHKYNKICQIIQSNNEKDDLFKSILNGKIETMHKKQESEMNRLLNNVEKSLNHIKHITKDYKLKTNDKNILFYQRQNDMRINFWNKFHVDRLANKKYFGDKPSNTSGKNISFK